jgi:ParB family chromosome partitioning protein
MAKLQLDDYLPTLEETSTPPDGRPMLLPVDRVDEDPAQPRSEFDADALRELAASIGLRGVLQPVSVRRHPEQGDRYVLNFGARRLRASKLAGKAEIPAFLDALAGSFDQVIENEHREALRPMELALVKRQLEGGKSQADVARELGKSRAYVSYVCALIDAPDWLMDVYRAGRCRGLKELYDLRRIHDKNPHAVEQLVLGPEDLSRGDIDALREGLAVDADRDGRKDRAGWTDPESQTYGSPAPAQPPKVASSGTAAKRECWCVLGEVGGRSVRIMLGAMPAAADEVYVIESGADIRSAVKLAELKALRLRRG